MLKFKDLENNKLCIYGDEVMGLFDKVKVVATTVYENGPALIVKKEESESKK